MEKILKTIQTSLKTPTHAHIHSRAGLVRPSGRAHASESDRRLFTGSFRLPLQVESIPCCGLRKQSLTQDQTGKKMEKNQLWVNNNMIAVG